MVRNPVLLQPEAAEDLAARPDRESIGGTQGAITGLTHLALQKHNQDVHLRTGSADHSAVSGLDTQQMALQASFSHLNLIKSKVVPAVTALTLVQSPY